MYRTQLQYLQLAESHAAPSQSEQNQLLQPTSLKIQAIQELREKNRSSQLFNHLSAISESIPALGWVTVVSLILFCSNITYLLTKLHYCRNAHFNILSEKLKAISYNGFGQATHCMICTYYVFYSCTVYGFIAVK